MGKIDQPRCGYVPFRSSAANQCRRPALVRVFRRHGAGEAPEYRERCLFHARLDLGPAIAAYWDAETLAWGATD